MEKMADHAVSISQLCYYYYYYYYYYYFPFPTNLFSSTSF